MALYTVPLQSTIYIHYTKNVGCTQQYTSLFFSFEFWVTKLSVSNIFLIIWIFNSVKTPVRISASFEGIFGGRYSNCAAYRT
jgi:hypothetical protein